jgi:pteridine reductase
MQSPSSHKTVLITGAAKRIGSVMARFFHGRGWSVFIHYRRAHEEALSLVRHLNMIRPNSSAAFALDLENGQNIVQLIEAVTGHFGRLDLLVNNASSFFPTKIGDIAEKDWEVLLASNLKAPFFLSQAAFPWLQKSQGSIVNITDIHAIRPLKHYGVYSIAKGGLNTLTRTLAIEFAPLVRVNAVAPGAIMWPEGGHFNEKDQQAIIGQTPLKRLGGAEDIAKTVYFLAEDAPFITGQIIAVDGGRELVL